VLWWHKDKSEYGSKTQGESRSGALANKSIHKIYQRQISNNYALASQGAAPVNPRGRTQNKVSYNVRAPVRVTHVKPINKERSIRKHERREEEKERNEVIGDAMRNVRVFFVRGECGEDIDAMVSGVMNHEDED